MLIDRSSWLKESRTFAGYPSLFGIRSERIILLWLGLFDKCTEKGIYQCFCLWWILLWLKCIIIVFCWTTSLWSMGSETWETTQGNTQDLLGKDVGCFFGFPSQCVPWGNGVESQLSRCIVYSFGAWSSSWGNVSSSFKVPPIRKYFKLIFFSQQTCSENPQ